MADGQPLSNVTDLFDMTETPTGATDSQYRAVSPIQDIAIPLSDNQQLFNGAYAVMEDDIILPGASQALDIRVLGEFRPVPIINADTPIIKFSETILAHWVCEMVGASRGATPAFMAYHLSSREQAIAELFNSLIMDIQQIPSQQRPFNTSGSFESF
jgi:hypothetical protein